MTSGERSATSAFPMRDLRVREGGLVRRILQRRGHRPTGSRRKRRHGWQTADRSRSVRMRPPWSRSRHGTVGDAAEAGDQLAREVLAVSGRWLGRGLALLIDILNPQLIVIGSIFIRCRPFLRPSMEAEIAREALPGAARACTIVPAKLGDSIGDYACLVRGGRRPGPEERR